MSLNRYSNLIGQLPLEITILFLVFHRYVPLCKPDSSVLCCCTIQTTALTSKGIFPVFLGLNAKEKLSPRDQVHRHEVNAIDPKESLGFSYVTFGSIRLNCVCF